MPTTRSSISSVGTRTSGSKDKVPLLARYFLATTLSRLSLDFVRKFRLYFHSRKGGGDSHVAPPKILRVPPASVYLLEKLGVATAFTLVDDELATEPQAVPQQLLIPSGKGLKLLDMCPMYEDDDMKEKLDGSASKHRPGDSFEHDSDSDSEYGGDSRRSYGGVQRKRAVFHLRRKRRLSTTVPQVTDNADHTEHSMSLVPEVQFEDPNWWQVRTLFFVFSL